MSVGPTSPRRCSESEGPGIITITFIGGTVDGAYDPEIETVCHWPNVPRTNDHVLLTRSDGKEVTGWVGRVTWNDEGVRINLGGG